jgi:hypothetical protein
MLDPKNAVPIAALFASDGINPNPQSDPRGALHAAELIIGMDVMSGHQFLLYGREALERIASTGEAEGLRTLLIALDQPTDELERAIALMQTVKGRCDYPGVH